VEAPNCITSPGYNTTPREPALGEALSKLPMAAGCNFLRLTVVPCAHARSRNQGIPLPSKAYPGMKSRATLVREGNVIVITVTALTQKGAGLAQSVDCNLDASFDFQQRPAILLRCYCPSCEDAFCSDQQLRSELTFLLRCHRNIRATTSVSVWRTGEFIQCTVCTVHTYVLTAQATASQVVYAIYMSWYCMAGWNIRVPQVAPVQKN
jgi:hypothetical protein